MSKLKVIVVTVLVVPGPVSPNVVGCLEGIGEGILRTSTTFHGHKNKFYDRFGTILWLHDEIVNWSFMAFWGNSDRVNHPRYIISRSASVGMFSAKNMTGPGGALKGQN